MSHHIVSVGDLVLDITMTATLPVEPDKPQDVPTRRIDPGGAGNFMIAARRMALDVSAAGVTGADLFGEHLTAMLREEGIDVEHIIAVPGSTSTLVIVLTAPESGQHTFLGNYGTGPAAPYPDGLDDRIAGADALFMQGYTLAEARVVPVATRAVEHAAAAGVPIYLDVGPFMAHVTPDRIAWAIKHAAVILTTEDEIPLICAGSSGNAAYKCLLDQGIEMLVIKQGPAGCTVITAEEQVHVPGFPVQVVDTVGAGDCFNAAFIAGRLNGLSSRQCGRLANAMGALVAGRMGAGRSAPTCAEVLALLEQNGERIELPC